MSDLFRNMKNKIIKFSPEILTGLGLSSMITSTVLAVNSTPKALDLLNKEKNEKNNELTKIEVVKATWKEYIPSISFGISGIILISCGCRINSKRSATFASAYAISEKAFNTYRNKVIETIGERKEKNMREKVDQDKVSENPLKNNQVIITSKGNTLIMDSLSGRYFRSDLDTIKKVINELNRIINTQNYISLNEYYNAIGLDSVKDGDHMGWCIDNGLIELDYGTCLADNDEPCICLDYVRMPKPNFDKIYN